MMKKTFIATAVASAFAFNAHADGHLSISGYAAAGVEFGDSTADGDNTNNRDVPQAANNMLHISGHNNLDNGSQSYANLGLTTTMTANEDISMRYANIGLRGDFGDVAFGMGEMVYEVGQIIDSFINDWGTAAPLTYTAVAGGAFNFTRIDEKSLVYKMSQMGLVKPTLVYGYGDDDEADGAAALDGSVDGAEYDDSFLQLALDYNNGAGMNAQFAYAAYTDVSATTNPGDANAVTAGPADATGMRITVRYDGGGFKLNATYQQLELDHAATPTDYTNASYNGKTWERDTIFLNLEIPTATGRVALSYGSADDVAVDSVAVAESGHTSYSVGYQYDLGPNTYVFARWAKADEDANYDIGDATVESTDSQIIGIKVGF